MIFTSHVVLLHLVLVALTSAESYYSSTGLDSPDLARTFLTKVKRQSYRKKVMCSANVIPYPLNGIRVCQGNDETSNTARSYYDNFSIRQYYVNTAAVSQFLLGIEYKKPLAKLSYKKAKIQYYNLLLTASLRVRKKDAKCQKSKISLLGFVELVETDVTWLRGKNGITQYTGKNLAQNDHLQYVMTKSNSQQRTMFANDSTWARTIVIPLNTDYMVPLKYESSEIMEVDFANHPDTEKYERLIEKKIFLVQTNLYNEVTEVLAGVGVMTYVKYETIGVTAIPQLNLVKNHGLIQQISNPEKYASVITNLNKKGSESNRDRSLMNKEHLPSSIGDTTLNPIPGNIRIYTE